jgi:aspartyl-tRNA(Asn)/glutamyl-tRNA(Gln) amidotransferase subunit A
MDTAEVCFLPVQELARLMAGRQLSPFEVTRAYLERIQQVDAGLRAYITVDAEQALSEARAAEQALARDGAEGSLHGVPLAIKDNIATRGLRTTAGSKVLGTWVPDTDAPVVQRLRTAGAIVLGKTNMHEFAYGGTCTNVHYGAVRNPWNREHVPGGSSGGSAVAVAAGLCAAALGTDTAGSVRLPACQCGIVGIKATYGRASIRGVIPLAWSLDHVGPMTRTVEDAALLLNAIAGWTPTDPTTNRAPAPDFLEGIGGGIRGMRLGVPRAYFFDGLQRDVEAAIHRALEELRGLGASLVDLEWPDARLSNTVTWTIILAEASAYHRGWIRSRPDDYGPDVRINLEQGEFLPATDYVQAQRVRSVLQRQVAALLEGVDALATPMLAITAPKVGETTVEVGGKVKEINPVFIRLADPFNVTGLPAISVPCGFGTDGLPIGLQLVGRPFAEQTVLRVAHAYEQQTDWHRRRPVLASDRAEDDGS